MDGAELVPVEIVDALERGAIVVTGNQRAARTLRRGFDQRNRQLGLNSWTPAAVLAWDAWTTTLWRELLLEGRATKLLLNRTQEHQVWRTILDGDDELASLRTIDSLAEMAADTWRLLSSYGGRERLRTVAGGTDTRAFQRWARGFERLCEAKGLIAVAQLEEALREAAGKGWIKPPPGGVVLVGFDALTPAQTGLVEALRSVGVDVEELPLQSGCSAAHAGGGFQRARRDGRRCAMDASSLGVKARGDNCSDCAGAGGATERD